MAILRYTLDGTTWVPFTVGADGPQGPEGPEGPQGPPGASVQIKGSVSTVGDLPATGVVGDGWITEDDGHLHVFITTTTTQDVGQIRGDPGPPGEITLATGDARYVRQASGSLTTGFALNTFTVKPTSGSHGLLMRVLSANVPIELAPVSGAGTALSNTLRFDATSGAWEVGDINMGAVSASSVAVSGKVTSQATDVGDAPETLVTKGYADDSVPTGAIIAWGGGTTVEAIPSGWALCDGSVHGSSELEAVLTAGGKPSPDRTPDLRSKFVVGGYSGAGSVSPLTARTQHADNLDGEESHTLSSGEIPAHNHGQSNGSSTFSATHSHDGYFLSRTDAYNGSHSHIVNVPWKSFRQTSDTGSGIEGTDPGSAWTNILTAYANNGDGSHQHQTRVQFTNSGSHSHTLASYGGGGSHNNMPPWYALAYIIRK